MKIFFKNQFLKWILLSGLALNGLVWIFAYSIINKIEGKITVLHYNVDLGADLIGKPTQFYLFPLFGLGIGILNFCLILFLSKSDKFWNNALALAFLIANILLILVLVAINLYLSR